MRSLSRTNTWHLALAATIEQVLADHPAGKDHHAGGARARFQPDHRCVDRRGQGDSQEGRPRWISPPPIPCGGPGMVVAAKGMRL